MFAVSWIGVVCALGLALSGLVWMTQHLLNTFHPWTAFRLAHRAALPVPVRLLLLILLWNGVAAVLAALPLTVLLSLPQGTHVLSSTLLSVMCGAAILGSVVLVYAAAALSARRWQQNRRNA